MTLKILLTIAAIYMALVGLGLILMPLNFGRGAVPENASAELTHFLRIWGSPLLGIAVLDWMSRNEGPSRIRNAVIVGNAIGFGVIALVDLSGLFTGTRELTKLFVVVHGIFAAAFIWAAAKYWTRES